MNKKIIINSAIVLVLLSAVGVAIWWYTENKQVSSLTLSPEEVERIRLELQTNTKPLTSDEVKQARDQLSKSTKTLSPEEITQIKGQLNQQ